MDNFPSLINYSHTDEKSGEVLLSKKHFWRFTAKLHCFETNNDNNNNN